MARNPFYASRDEAPSSDVIQDRPAEDGEQLLAAFVACRTTLDDLSGRAAALGENVSVAAIASHLTGTCEIPDAEHNAVAEAINVRLAELSLPAAAPYRHGMLAANGELGSTAFAAWFTGDGSAFRAGAASGGSAS